MIETERLVIRPFTDSDYAAWRDSYSKRLPSQNEFDSGKIDLSEYDKNWFCNWNKENYEKMSADYLYLFGIFLQTDGTVVGTVETTTLIRDSAFSWGFIGYSIHNQHWNNGYATEAVQAITEFNFRQLKFTRLEIACEKDNVASSIVAKRCGYTFECVRKNFLNLPKGAADVDVYYKNAKRNMG